MTWRDFTIGDLGRVVTGKTPDTKNRAFYDGAYPFVTPSDIGFNQYVCEATETTVTDLARDRLPNQFIPGGSVIVTCIGNTIGKTAIAATECLTNQQMNSIVVNRKHDEKFIYYLICHNVERIRGVGLGGGAAQPIINKSTFCALKVRAPEKTLQTAIARLLSAYDDLISNNARRIELLERSARLLFEEWFVRLRYPGHEQDKIVDGVPEGWCNATIGDLGTVVTGKTPSKSSESNFNGDIPFVKTPDMHGKVVVIEAAETLSEQGARSQMSKYIPPMSTMVSCIGSVGVVALNAILCQTNQQINTIVPRRPEHTFYNYCVAINLKSHLEAIGGGVTMANVSKSKFESIKCIIPNQRLLTEFDALCRPAFSQITVLQKLNQKARTARDLLLPRLMDGSIEV